MGLFKTDKPIKKNNIIQQEPSPGLNKPTKPKQTKSDLQIVLGLQREYDGVIADMRVVNNSLLSLLDNGILPNTIEFRTRNANSEVAICYDLIEMITKKYDFIEKPKN